MITGDDLYRILKHPIAFHRVFSEVGGGVTAGLLLSQLFYLSREYADEEGWFYHSAKFLMDETTMTRAELDGARKRLRERGLIEEELRGMPAQLHWRVDINLLANLIAENPQTGVQKSRNQDRGNPANKVAEKPQSFPITDQETDQNKAGGFHPQDSVARWQVLAPKAKRPGRRS